MKKRSNLYWKRRANERMAGYHKNTDETVYKINKAYDRAINNIDKDIRRIFNRYFLSYGISKTEARDLLNSFISKKELNNIRDQIKLIEDEDLKKYLMAQLNYSPYKARITRLEALKESIYVNTRILAQEEFRQSTNDYVNNIKSAYYQSMFDIQKGLGIGFSFAEMPSNSIEEVLRNKWSGEHYSKRIWKNTDVLAEKLEEVITSGLMSGQSSRRMAKELQELTNYGKFAAERLIRTETTYITNMAEIEAYKESGIDKYVFVATLDLRTSEVCRRKDGKVISVSEGVPGINMPPMHPFCRSTTIAYFDAETLRNIQRRARDPETGKNYIVSGAMDYQDWYDKLIIDKYGKDRTEVFENIIKNKSNDRKQYKKYKEALGNLAPPTFEKFQDLKYNFNEAWGKLKNLYDGNYSEDELADIKSFFSELFGDKSSSNRINLNIKQIPKNHYNDILNIVEKAPIETKNIFLNNIDNINFIDINLLSKERARYSPKERGIYINLEEDSLDVKGKGKYATVFHEIGHLIDKELGRPSCRNKHFKNAIINDVNRFIINIKKSYDIKTDEELVKFISNELKTSTLFHSLSDIIGGVTGNKIVGKFGHKDEYWLKKYSLEKETFAHFFEATIRNDKNKLVNIENIFEESYNIFKDIIRRS